MRTQFEEGRIFEEAVAAIFRELGVEMTLLDYSMFADLQNRGIDAELNSPPGVAGKTLQIKMFRNTAKYGTFPWEVSRYIADTKDFKVEPHKADFHVVVDTLDPGTEDIIMIFWLFRTGNLQERYRELWIEAAKKFGVPSETNARWKKVEGKKEPYFKLSYKGETLYQLTLKHTALQRNVRCRVAEIPNHLRFDILVNRKMLEDFRMRRYTFEHYPTISERIKSYIPALHAYLSS